MFAIMSLLGLGVAAFVMPDITASSDEEPDDLPEQGERNMDQLVASDGATPATSAEPDDPIVLHGSNIADFIRGGAEAELLLGDGGNDRLEGGAGDDTLDGGDGDDVLFGQAGDDSLQGEGGDDWLVGGDGADRLDGGDGNDTLEGMDGDDHMFGGAGEDTLMGGRGDDTLIGSDDEVRDYLNGQDGDDWLVGGRGDVLHGGDGSDTFALSYGEDGACVVADFVPGQDRIALYYDGDTPPELATEVRGSGLTLYADGVSTATFAGLTELDTTTIMLVRDTG